MRGKACEDPAVRVERHLSQVRSGVTEELQKEVLSSSAEGMIVEDNSLAHGTKSDTDTYGTLMFFSAIESFKIHSGGFDWLSYISIQQESGVPL